MTRPRFFIFLLIAITASGPFSMQIFLPALPAITGYFAVTPGAAQLTLSLSMAAIALATLTYGPLADRFGRRPILLGGLAMFLAGSVVSAVAPTLDMLVLGRILQGAGGAAGMVIARAMVRDVYGAENSAKVLSYVTMAMVLAPMVAPALGGWLTETSSWRANFFVIVGLIAALTAVVAVSLGETRPAGAQAQGPGAMLRSFGTLVTHPGFCGHALQAAFSLAIFFAFISAAPYLMKSVMGRSATEYGLWFMSVSGAFVAGSFTSARLTARVGLDRMIAIGLLSALATILIAGALLALLPLSPLLLFGPAVPIAFAQGLVIPNAQAGALNARPEMAGSASGLTGFLQMGIAAGAAQAVGSLEDGTPYPMIGFMLLLSLAASSSILLTRHHARRTARASDAADAPPGEDARGAV